MFYSKYLEKNEQINALFSFRQLIVNFFNVKDDEFIECFEKIIKYIQNKYDIQYKIKTFVKGNEKYMKIFTSYIIQIMYNVSKIIIDNKINEYIDQKKEENDTFMYFLLDIYLKEKVDDTQIRGGYDYIYEKINSSIDSKIN